MTMKKNLFKKENIKRRFSEDYYVISESAFQSSTNAIYFLRELEELKVKANNNTKGTWLSFIVGKAFKGEVFEIEFEMKSNELQTCVLAEATDISHLENIILTISEQEKGQWIKVKGSTLIKKDTTELVFSFGAYTGYVSNFHIRNCFVSSKKQKSTDKQSLIDTNFSAGTVLKIATFFKEELANWSTLNFFHCSEKYNSIVTLSALWNATSAEITYLNGTVPNQFFEIYKNVVGDSIDFYLKTLRTIDNFSVLKSVFSKKEYAHTPYIVNSLPPTATLHSLKINKMLDHTIVSSLDTPYYTLKMQEQGIYDDYVAYRDELHEYENSRTGDDTMLLPVLQEPAVPKSVKAFAERYKLI